MSLIETKIKNKTYLAYDRLLDKIIEGSVEKSFDFLLKAFITNFSIEIKYDLYDVVWNDVLLPLKKIDKHFKKDYVKKNSYINYKGIQAFRAKTFYTVFFPNIKSFLTVWMECSEGDEYLHIFFWGKKPSVLYKFYLNLSQKQIVSEEKTVKYIFVYNLYTDKNTDECYWKNKLMVFTKTWDKLFMEKDLKDRIINYLDSFKKARPLFSYMEVTYKLGILLYGPPGTGKTSLAKIIAGYFQRDLYIVNMSCFSPKVVEKINSTASNDELTIFLLEDIDYIFGKRQNDRTPEEKANGNALLQLLDGANSSSNVIFIATTNDIDCLDPAIIREGRFDLKVHMDNISTPIAEQMVTSIGVPYIDIIDYTKEKHNPAQIQNKIVQYVFDNIEDISSFIKDKEEKDAKSNID